MKKYLVTLAAMSMVFAFSAANAMKHEMPPAVKKACEGKPAGTEVTVDGKKSKCMEPKKAEPAKK